jgi:DNA modification methylase
MLTHEPKIEMLATAALIPYARNAKRHDDVQVAKLAGSIREYGFTNPVLIDGDNGIIAGHGRVMGAQKLGLAEVPCIRLAHLTETQKRAYVLADNRLAEIGGGWDADMLRIEVEELREAGVDLDGIGLDAAALAELVPPPDESNEGTGEPDDVPEVPVQPVSVLGDVWVMGKHRIICGSSTEASVVEKVLAGARPHLMVTDPPYGVEYDPKWRLEAGINKAHQKRAEGVVMNDDRSDWREAWALFPGAVAYVWHGALHAANVAESLIASGFEIRSQIIWAKSSLVMGRGHYHWQHEPCWYAARGAASWAGDRKQSTLWQIQNMHRTQGNVDDGKTNHSTQKPVECMKRPIENNSVAGDHVYEPFSGSGTTIIAGEMTGRCVHAIELNPAYVDIAVARWQTFTGKEAVNEATGLTFAATKAKMEGA